MQLLRCIPDLHLKAAPPISAQVCCTRTVSSLPPQRVDFRRGLAVPKCLIPVYGNRGVARQRGGDRRLGVYIRQHELAPAEALPRDGLCAGGPYALTEDRQQHHT